MKTGMFSVLLRGFGALLVWAAAAGSVNAAPYTFGNGAAYTSTYCMSGNGRYVVFQSDANNLVPGDTNSTTDIFRWDVQSGDVICISVRPNGACAGGYNPSINGDGNLVAFRSYASTIVSGDTNGQVDIFVRDVFAGTTTRVNVDSAGAQAVGTDNDASRISLGGTSVAFSSTATNLAPGDTNGVSDIYVHNMTTGITSRVSISSAGAEANAASYFPAISGDGTRVIFTSTASNLVSGDTNGVSDLFLRDISAGTTTRINVSSAGAQGSAAVGYYATISSDGSKAAFFSDATNLVSGDTNGVSDVFVRDIGAGTTTRVSVDDFGVQGNGGSSLPTINADGTRVGFLSGATNLVSGDTNGQADIFLRDIGAGTTILLSVDSSGVQANAFSSMPAISSTGTRVSFYSTASNLVPGDGNGFTDVFVRDVAAGQTYGPGVHVTNAAAGWGLFE